jgi:hypothetical protein
MSEGKCDPTAKPAPGQYFGNAPTGSDHRLGQVYKVDQCNEQCAKEVYGDARRIIARLIDHHNRQANWLCALERALPRELTPEAERGLYELAKAALGNIR